MGEETKKIEGAQKAESENKDAKADAPDDKKCEESKETKEAPPPIILRVYMHCEGCARKVRRCLRGFQGVEDVITDCRTHKVVVKGGKADPQKILERVQRKSHRQVELLFPVPKPPADDAKKEVGAEDVKAEPKKDEQPPPVITAILKVHMHCEACAEEIKKRIHRMQGIQSVKPDLKGAQVSVKGVFDPAKLVDYLQKRTGKHVVVVEEPKKEEEKPQEEKKPEAEGEKASPALAPAPEPDTASPLAEAQKDATSPAPAVVEMRRNEYNYQYAPVMYNWDLSSKYPPQMFSDENPNACTVM